MGLTCPRKLFYRSRPTEYEAASEKVNFITEHGKQLGEFARKLFPGGIDLSRTTSHEASLETAHLLEEAIKAGTDLILFEPAFEFQQCLARVDVLILSHLLAHDKPELHIIEVKSSSQGNEPFSKLNAKNLPLLQDIAFQEYVVGSRTNLVSNSYLMMPNKSKTATKRCLDTLTGALPSGTNCAAETIRSFLADSLYTSTMSIVNVNSLLNVIRQEQTFKYPGGNDNPLDSLTLPELKKICKERKMRGFSTLKKAELVAALAMPSDAPYTCYSFGPTLGTSFFCEKHSFWSS